MLATAIASAYAELARQHAAHDTAVAALEVRTKTVALFRHRHENGLETLGSVRQVESRQFECRSRCARGRRAAGAAEKQHRRARRRRSGSRTRDHAADGRHLALVCATGASGSRAARPASRHRRRAHACGSCCAPHRPGARRVLSEREPVVGHRAAIEGPRHADAQWLVDRQQRAGDLAADLQRRRAARTTCAARRRTTPPPSPSTTAR